jgi:hypothetical protein
MERVSPTYLIGFSSVIPMSKRRTPYRPGTASHARVREAALKRQIRLAEANAARAKTPETRRRSRKHASAARRALREIEQREEFRSKLNEHDRREFNSRSIAQQQQFLRVTEAYPDRVPPDVPDPFGGARRNPSWRLYYSTRAGMRPRAVA